MNSKYLSDKKFVKQKKIDKSLCLKYVQNIMKQDRLKTKCDLCGLINY